jgi:molecular chaperone DnaK (HSP70)
MGKIIGIDLGTTNSVVAVMDGTLGLSLKSSLPAPKIGAKRRRSTRPER